MPPRRSARASSSSRLFDGSSEAGGPLDNVQAQSVHTGVGRGMSPGPAKYSSAYGSPPTILPTRQNVARQRYNFTSALSHVVDAVEKDNENDARERAEREAEQQRRRSEIDQTHANQAAQASAQDAPRQSEETLESVELVREPAGEREPTAADSSDQNPKQSEQPTSSSEPAQPAGPTRAARITQVSQPRDGPPARNFDEEDRVFAEAQIFTPVLPSRTSGVVSKTSNILQNLLNSARRISTVHEDPDDEAIRQAYPQFQFIRPRPDNLPADTGEQPAQTNGPPADERRAPRPSATGAGSRSLDAEGTEAETAAATPAAAAPAGVKAIKSRIATPGPGVGVRSRRSLFRLSRDPTQDELAGNGNEAETTASARSLLGRRRSTRTQPQPAVEERQRRQPQPSTGAEDSRVHRTRPPTASPRKGKWGYLWDISEVTKALAMAITFIVLSVIAVRVFVISTSPSELYDGYRIDNRLRWYGSDWRSNLRQLVPFALVHPLGAISDEEFARINGLILSHANEVAQMKHTDRLHSDALDSIGHILPAMVHMELDRRGRPVISQEFWHALKDNIQADKDIFTLIWNKDGSMAVSDLQWTALKRQLQTSGMLPDPNTKALSVPDVEEIAEAKLSKSWESWLRTNQNKVKNILGVIAAADNTSPSPPQVDYGQVIERLSDDQIAKLARQMAASAKAKEVLVPRQDFLQILQNTFVEHRLEIKGEMADLEARVIDIARAAASAVSSVRSSPSESSPSSTGAAGGMNKREIMSLVDQLVRKGISDAQLEAMARGKIKANWDSNLINQVNFFSRNTGATFNHHFSSPAYTPFKPPFWKRRNGVGGYGGGGSAGGGAGEGSDSGMEARPAPGSLRGSVAFEQWEQDGDCWCAATHGSHKSRGTAGNNNEGSADIAVKLGLRIVPQYVVVEHISPSATLDPGAMPKDLEVWVQITDYAQQRPLQDWSISQFPDTDDQSSLLGWGFVKVGAFTFEANKAGGGGGAQVFRLSPELEALGAVTDHVIVRALTNHGGKDHTCFYRVRLYGELWPDVVE